MLAGRQRSTSGSGIRHARETGVGTGTLLAVGVGLLSLSACSGSPAIPETRSAEPIPAYDALTQGLIDQQWESVVSTYPDAVRPDVHLERYVTIESAPGALEACMHGEGFSDVTVRSDGSLESGSLPEAQRQTYAVSMWKCMAEFPYEPRFNQRLSTEQLAAIYRYYAGELTDCLEDLGYTVDAPPSETTFVEGYYTAPDLWSPYSAVLGSTEDPSSAYATCPILPPDLFGSS